jgi:hypothetical protein
MTTGIILATGMSIATMLQLSITWMNWVTHDSPRPVLHLP